MEGLKAFGRLPSSFEQFLVHSFICVKKRVMNRGMGATILFDEFWAEVFQLASCDM